MRKLLLILVAVLPAFSQAVRVDPQPTTTVSSVAPAGSMTPVLAIPGAIIAISGTTYTSEAASTACPSNKPVVLAGTSTCVAASDAQGNFGFWMLPGSYTYTITLPYSGKVFGPYPVTAFGPNYVPVTAFGGDPTCTKDSTAAFNNAIASLVAGGGGTLFIPKGNYCNASSITFNPKVNLVGEQSANTSITISTTAPVLAFEQPTGTSVESGFQMQHLSLHGTNLFRTNQIVNANTDGIIINGHIDDVQFYGSYNSGEDPNYQQALPVPTQSELEGYGVCVQSTNFYNLSISKSYFQNCGIGVEGVGSDNINVADNRFQGNASDVRLGALVVIGDADGINFPVVYHNFFGANKRSCPVNVEFAATANIDSNWFENPDAGELSMMFLCTSKDYSTYVTNNVFVPNHNNHNTPVYNFAPNFGMVVYGNWFENSPASNSYYATFDTSNYLNNGVYTTIMAQFFGNQPTFPIPSNVGQIEVDTQKPLLVSAQNPGRYQMIGSASATYNWVTDSATGDTVLNVGSGKVLTYVIPDSASTVNSTLIPGTGYKLTMTGRQNTADSSFELQYLDGGVANTVIYNQAVGFTSTLGQVIYYFTLPAGATGLSQRIQLGFGGDAYIQSWQIEALPNQPLIVTLPFGGSPQWRLNLPASQAIYKVTLTGTITAPTFVGGTAGQNYALMACQDGTGGHFFNLPSNVLGARLAGGVNNYFTANGCTNYLFQFDGTNFHLLSIRDDSGMVYTNSVAVQSVYVTANYSALDTDANIMCDATSGNVTVTLPASTVKGRSYRVMKVDSSVNTCTISAGGSTHINGGTTQTISTQYAHAEPTFDSHFGQYYSF